ncbi:DNase I-like protein [Dichomitus squalens]|uniref:DNase I-like protein n=1 Tax=Dichomitus squalens TaxID=114155 RepID=A0A4Q9Q6I9_9APHY|nr:DNase I-like protein [Dichomitus squalens]
MKHLTALKALVLLACGAWAVTISEIQGTAFQSPLAGQFVHGLTGVVTAKDKYGVWIQDDRTDDPRASNGIRVYGSAAVKYASIGDLISLSGRVAEYRKTADDLFLTEIDYVTALTTISSGHTVEPIILGEDRIPPRNQLSSLDIGRDGWLSVPSNLTLLESVNPSLRPDEFGLDFWESLEGQLVTVKAPTAAQFPDRFGSVWVYGNWPTTGKNERGGRTIHSNGPDEAPPAHPEAIFIGRPMDGTRNPKAVMGAVLSDVTGVVAYQFGYYYILPLTAPEVVEWPDFDVPSSTLNYTTHPCQIRIGDYNVENMNPRSYHIPKIASHIAHHLHTPDIVFVQEIQDDSGARNDGVVSANRTLRALVNAIKKASGGVEYEFVNVEPEDNKDGGQPGGNIRVAYLYRPEQVSLVPGSIGNATLSTVPLVDWEGNVELSYNPGRIEPEHSAWEEARKPLAAAWQLPSGDRFFTVNVHFSSKRFSSSPQGNARPPVNGGFEKRTSQANVTAHFVSSLLDLSPNASVIVAGDMNEFTAARSVLRPLAAILIDANDVCGVPLAERYTYAYDQHAQEIDHVFVSDAIARRGGDVEHVHVNTWARTVGERASDHDPTVARLWVCDAEIDAAWTAVEYGTDHGQTVL